MNATRKVKLKDINPNLTCILCKGYFIDATTIMECLHSFCKSCIVKHLEKSEYCPACDVQLHTTKPLSSIRSDQMLQEIVYKLVPGLFQTETARRRQFYKENPESIPSSQEDSGHVYNYSYITSDDIIHLSLEYHTDDTEFRESTKRYIKCPAAVSIGILKKLIYGKFDLDSGAQIDIMYGDRILPDDFLLMDIAYKYSWTHNGNKPLQLCYNVKGIPKSSYLHLVKPKNNSTPAVKAKVSTPAVKRRQSRTSTNAAATAITVTEKSTGELTPGGKVSQRGKSKRKVADNKESAGNNAKKVKADQKAKSDLSAQPIPSSPSVPKDSTLLKVEPAGTASNLSPNNNVLTANPECKEVQLRISENGVISARSVSSGEEKIIINNGVTNSSTNMTATSVKTTTVTNLTPGHMLSHLSNISALPSPLDIAINRVNCAQQPIPNDKQSNAAPPLMITNCSGTNNNNSNVNGFPNTKFNLPPGTKLTPIRKKKEKSILTTPDKQNESAVIVKSDTLKTKVSKKNNNQDNKCANVKKAMSDLEKKLQTHTRKYTKKGAVTSNSSTFPKDSPGLSVPISTQTSQNHQQLNGSRKHSVQSPLLHSLPQLPQGTGLSLVPTTSPSSFISDSLLSPNKRFPPHNTHTTASVINGDLKFKTSPKHTFSTPSKDSQSVSTLSPKKPPKFFKSRHSTSSGSLVDGESATGKQFTPPKLTDRDNNTKGKLHSQSMNGFSPKGSGTDSSSNNSNVSQFVSTTNSTPTTSTAGFGSMGPNSQFKFPPNLTNTLNAINMNLNMNNLNVSLAAAANGVPINLVPFVTNSYCSMPFMNSRNPFNMNMPHMNMPYPYSYPGVSVQPAPTTTVPSSSSSPVNVTKPSNPHPIPITSTTSSNINNNFLSAQIPANQSMMTTLDLSMAKTKPSHQESANGKESTTKFRPITTSSNLLGNNSHKIPLVAPTVDRNHNNKAEFLNIPRVAGLSKNKSSPKATITKQNSGPRKSPIKNLEALLAMSGNGGKQPHKSTPEKPVTNKSPGKKDLADIIGTLADQKKLEMQASVSGAANSTNNNNSTKHINNNSITVPIIPNLSSSTSNSNSTGEKNNTAAAANPANNKIINTPPINGNSSSTSNLNGETPAKCPTSATNSNSVSVNKTTSSNSGANVLLSLSPCKSNVVSDNLHHNNNNNTSNNNNNTNVREPVAIVTVGGDSSSCGSLNDNNIVMNGSNSTSNANNMNSNGPLQGLNNLIANSTGGSSSTSANNNINGPTANHPVPSSSSTSA